MAAGFGPPQRGKAYPSVSERQKARQAKLGQLQIDRLSRRAAPRCACGHGYRVHDETGCRMDACDCEVSDQ